MGKLYVQAVISNHQPASKRIGSVYYSKLHGCFFVWNNFIDYQVKQGNFKPYKDSVRCTLIVTDKSSPEQGDLIFDYDLQISGFLKRQVKSLNNIQSYFVFHKEVIISHNVAKIKFRDMFLTIDSRKLICNRLNEVDNEMFDFSKRTKFLTISKELASV